MPRFRFFLKFNWTPAQFGQSRSLSSLSLARYTRSLACLLLIVVLMATTACTKKKEVERQNRVETTERDESQETQTPVVGDVPSMTATAIVRPVQGSGKFERLDPAETGLDFQESVVPDHELSRLYDTFVVGGVAIGDVDGDQIPDVFCAGTANSSRLYIQTSPFKFTDQSASSGLEEAGNPWSVGASFVDIDNDDDLDLYVCNFSSPNQLWINDGKGHFTEQAAKFGVDINDASVMSYFGDFDNDGFVDMYVVTYRLFNPEGWISNLDIGQAANGAYRVEGKWADYFKLIAKPNGKHKVRRKGREDYFFLNVGGKKFVDRTAASGISGHDRGMSAVLWDYDNDNDLDIYVCNDLEEPDRLYENNGKGVFKDVIQSVFKHTSWNSMGSDIADVNNDGRTDLFTVDMAGSSHYLSKANMGSMDKHRHFLDTAEPRQAMRNFLHIGAGSITGVADATETRYLETAQLAGVDKSDWSWAAVLRDFDCDGWCDAFVTNGHIRNFNNPDFEAPAVDAIENRTLWNLHKNEEPMLQVNAAYRNKNGRQFENAAALWGLDHNGVSYATATGDLDQDGDLDLVVMNIDEPISVYRNDTGSLNSLTIKLKGTKSNRDGFGAKIQIETDSGVQLYEHSPHRGYISSHEAIAHFGLGKHSKVNKLIVKWPSGISQTFEGVKANQRLTIVEREGNSIVKNERAKPMFARAVSSGIAARNEIPFDDYSLQPLLPNKLSQLGPGVSVVDLDKDGHEDVYASTPTGLTKSIAFAVREGQPGNSNGGGARNDVDFRSVHFESERGKEELAPLFFDADGDGDLDLYVVCGGFENRGDADLLADTFLINQGDGQFEAANAEAIPDTQFSGGAVAAADYDRDGDLDLFVGGRVVVGSYPTTPPSMLMRNETKEQDNPVFVDATSSDATGLKLPGMVTCAMWSDVNDDGWVDLLLTTEWGPVQIYLNNEGRLEQATERCGLAAHLGWWNGIAVADFDRDGDMDFVVTNFGMNTKYSASPKKPARIYYGKFGGNEHPVIIEVKTEESCELPIRGKSCSQHAVPQLAEKFPTYHEFALSPLDEIFSPSEIETATKFEATELKTCLLRNDGNGVFTFEALPWLAQVSPGFGVVATDINSDGWSDLFIAQNFFTPQRETGRLAGGLSALFLGSSSGDLQPVWPDASGIAIEADAKGAAIGDFNNDMRPDLVVGINDEEPRFFLNQESGRRPLVVRLVGKGKNQRAIGARVQVLMENGLPQTAEVRAGGSYLSQSTTDLYFGLGESDKVKSIHVRWADGSEQDFEPPAHLDRVVELKQ